MIIGVPKEIKEQEQRVALLPSGANQLTRRGHSVVVETNAGVGSGYPDQDYAKAGAEIIQQAKEVFARADMIVKVKEPLEAEFPLLRREQILFTYLHLAASKALTEALLKSGVTGVAYETIQVDHRLPLLEPMSEIAGRMSVVMGAYFLAKYNGGSGVLLGGVPGVLPGRVVVVGGGTSGVNALRMAKGLGGDVTILDIDVERLRFLDIAMENLHTLYSNRSKFGGINARLRFAHRGSAFARSQSAEAGYARNVTKNEAWQCVCRYFHRSGRLRGDVATDNASRSSLRRGRCNALLRGKHARGVCPHCDTSAYECDLSLRRVAGRSRPGRRVQKATGVDWWNQYARWPADLPGGRRGTWLQMGATVLALTASHLFFKNRFSAVQKLRLLRLIN